MAEQEIQALEADPPVVEPVVEGNEPSAVEEAKKYGWRPKEDFDLAPEGWVDADRFMELPSTQVKIARDENKALKASIEADRKDFEERLSRIDSAAKAATESALAQRQAEHERQLESIARSQRQAAEVGDLEEYDRLEGQRAKMAPPEQPQMDVSSQITALTSDYPWLEDPEMIGIADAVIEQNPFMKKASIEKQVEFVHQRIGGLVKKEEKAPAPKPQINRTDPGGLGGGQQQTKTLPPEAMAAAREFVEEGVFKSVDDYAKVYWKGTQ